jgi:L-fuconolactonase
VGWIDLQPPDKNDRLQHFKQYQKLVGYRHIVQSEEPTFLERPAFRNGIRHLREFDLTYDILIYPHQLKAAIGFAAAFPDQRFILDHLAKPYIKKGLIDEWKKDLQELAALDNVWCKISGLVTEADWHLYKPEDLFPYVDIAIESFGIDRVVYGSDWPVCLVAADYGKVVSIMQQAFERFSDGEKDKFFGLNATRFYKLNN